MKPSIVLTIEAVLLESGLADAQPPVASADFSCAVTDPGLSMATAGVNSPSVAGADAHVVDETETLNVAAPGVLGNDSDADGDALTASVGTLPFFGTLTMSGGGSFNYVHDDTENFSDSFTYIVSDGANVSAPATVEITIVAANDNAPNKWGCLRRNRSRDSGRGYARHLGKMMPMPMETH